MGLPVTSIKFNGLVKTNWFDQFSKTFVDFKILVAENILFYLQNKVSEAGQAIEPLRKLHDK